MNPWWWASILLMATAAAMLLAGAQRERTPPRISRRFEEALRGSGADISPFARFDKLGANDQLTHMLERFSRSEYAEMQRTLAQAGWGTTPQMRFYLLLGAWLGPFAAAAAMGIYAIAKGSAASAVLMNAMFAFAFVFVGMRRLLRWRATQRREAMRKEVVAWLHLLRMLFDAGLSLEHTLQVITQQARNLIPNLAVELESALKRIQAGQDRGEALAEMAAPLEVAELNDTVAMLRQVTRYGGNIRDSLVEYTGLIEQRQVSELREIVSKLSAKMTIVMVVFLFPALMIFVAGPGFIGLANALKNVGG